MTEARADVVLPVTLHARPAALIVRAATAGTAHVRVAGANARSVTELLCLGARAGQRVELTAEGPDAERALAAVLDVVVHLADPPADEGEGR